MLNFGTRFVHMAQEAWELESTGVFYRRGATMLNIPTVGESKNKISYHLSNVWKSQGDKDRAAFLADGIGPENVAILVRGKKRYAEDPADEDYRLTRRTDRDDD
jgi:hypothetical protein